MTKSNMIHTLHACTNKKTNKIGVRCQSVLACVLGSNLFQKFESRLILKIIHLVATIWLFSRHTQELCCKNQIFKVPVFKVGRN